MTPAERQDPNLAPCGVGCKVEKLRRDYFDGVRKIFCYGGGMFGEIVGGIILYGGLIAVGYIAYKKLKK